MAERAWLDGHTRAAVVRPDTEWGVRVASAFSEAWEMLGGEIVKPSPVRDIPFAFHHAQPLGIVKLQDGGLGLRMAGSQA